MELIVKLLAEIRAFYLEHAPSHIQIGAYEKAAECSILDFEEKIGEPLPNDYRTFLLCNDYEINFDMNFASLDIESVVGTWHMYTTFLRNGAFNDGRVEYHEENGFGNWDGDYIKKVWWSEKWIPISRDACGNMKCLDLDPGINGVKYQLVAMEAQDAQGPFIESYKSFTDYLEAHLNYLRNNKYTLDKFYDGTTMICIDSLIK